MRIRLSFEDPLPAYKCWYEVPASCSTIHDLQRDVRKGFNLDQYCKTTRLDLDGFFLLPASTIAGSLRDGDLLQVMIRKKGDGLPPRHLPVSGGKKRSSEDAGLSNAADRKASKKMKSTPLNKKPTAPLAKQDNAQQPGQGQQKQQPSAQNNKKKTQQNNKKAKQNNSNNNNAPQQNTQQSPSKDNVQAKANKKSKKTQQNKKAKQSNSNNNKPQQNNQQLPSNGTKGSKNNRTVNVDLDKSVNERRNVRFAPESTSQPKKAAMSDSSSSGSSSDSSSSSDTSNSDRDSSDSSDGDSSSSDSDSDSDSSSSESDSNKRDEKKAAATRIAPGMGMGATKSRNARRKLLKMKLAEAREEAVSGSDTSGINPLKRHTVAVTQLVDTTPATPPLRTSGKTAKAAPQASGKDSTHNNKKTPSPQANRKAPAQASTPPKVIMTSVDLKDSELMTKTTPKRVTRSTQKKPNGTAQEIPETPQPETGVKQKDSGSNKTVPAENESDDPSEVDVTPRDYHSLPKSEDSLAIGDVIAFKTLEMGPSYQPIISDFKEATVLSYSTTDMTAEVQLARKFRTPVQLDDDGNPILGKFDIYDEEEVERARRGIVSFDILGLADCRIISKR